ncbi:hypothetical protein BDAP_001183 [Binucleata daphniae]
MNKISCIEYEENEIVKLTNDMFNACDKHNEKIQKIKKIITKNLLCISKLLEKNTLDNEINKNDSTKNDDLIKIYHNLAIAFIETEDIVYDLETFMNLIMILIRNKIMKE